MDSKVVKDSFNFMELLHHRPLINHFIGIESRDKEFLTCCILFHVPHIELLPQLFGRFHVMVEVEQRVAHRVEDVTPTGDIIHVPLLPSSDLTHGLVLHLLRSWCIQDIRQLE